MAEPAMVNRHHNTMLTQSRTAGHTTSDRRRGAGLVELQCPEEVFERLAG